MHGSVVERSATFPGQENMNKIDYIAICFLASLQHSAPTRLCDSQGFGLPHFSLGAVREASCTNQILAGWTWHWSKQFSYGFFASWRQADFSFHAIENITSQKISCRVSGKMQFKRILAFGGAASDANNLLVTICSCSSPSVLAIHHIHSADSKHIGVPFPSSRWDSFQNGEADVQTSSSPAIRGCWDSPPRNWSPKVWSCKNPALWVL